MENKVKRIGYLPRKRVLEIIDEISKSESISRSKVVGILVEEALDARGIANFGYSNISKANIYKSDNFKDLQKENARLKDAEDEFVDDSGYTVSSHKTLDRSISSADIELANKINILKESGLIWLLWVIILFFMHNFGSLFILSPEEYSFYIIRILNLFYINIVIKNERY